ncbi:hypothetical protein V8F06_012721 [Rhypophila decipiens]
MSSAAAPGQSTSHQEPVCYNCGVKGHWVVACPEPTRDVPAGLKRWQSQHQESSPTERSHSSGDKRGPVVTRYPPPPVPPPITRYGPPQHAPSYPQTAPPPPPPPHGYPQPVYPPPPAFAGPYPPPPPPGYGQFPPHPHPPPGPPQAAQYAQPPPYPQPQYPPPYPPPGYYPNAGPPPPPYPPSAYSPQQYGPPPIAAGPYPPHYPVTAPPPPQDYRYPPTQVPPYHGPPPPAAAPYVPGPAPGYSPPPSLGAQPPPSLPPKPPPPSDRRNKHKNRGSKRGDFQKDKHRQGNEPLGKNHTNRNERRQKQQHREGEKKPRPTAEKVKEPIPEKEKDLPDGEWNPASEEDAKHVFLKVETKPADPVGIPLPPEYNDDPTIPPAYNAKSIKFAFLDANDPEAFVKSIRASPHWSLIKQDPVFDEDPGMIMRQFEGCEHEFATYILSPPPSPSFPIKLPPKFKIDRSRSRKPSAATPAREMEKYSRHSYSTSHDHLSPNRRRRRDSPSRPRHDQSRDSRWAPKRSHDRSSSEIRDHKRARWADSRRDAPYSNNDRPLSPARRSSSPKVYVERDPWSPRADDIEARGTGDYRYLDVPSTRDGKSPARDDRVSPSKLRNDSGYHSGQSADKGSSSYRGRDDERPGAGRGRERSSHGKRPARSPPRSRSRSPSRSVTTSSPSSRRSRSESPLTALEAELLGIETPAKKMGTKAPKKPVKRVKVAAAFSRRW